MSDIHMLDRAIREPKRDRSLVSFNIEKNGKRYHIGTGFLYTLDNYNFLVTANHVIQESLNTNDKVYVVFQINKSGGYLKCPITNLKFFQFESYDLAFCLLLPELLFSDIPTGMSCSIVPFTYRDNVDKLEDAVIENNMLLFGYTATENTVSLKRQEYSFSWRTLLTKKKEIKSAKVNIVDPIFVEFAKNETIDLDESLSIEEMKVSGNFPELKGMSGGPCLQPKIKNEMLIIDNVCGVIVEKLKKAPFNEKVIVIAPIYPVIDKIKEVVKDLKSFPKNIHNYVSS